MAERLSTAAARAAFRKRLLKWYREKGRVLPWRESRLAYRIWISEIMLQQTTVAAVVPYFERFLARFPDVFALAAAPQDEVLRLWEGLGYYSRARNLWAAAQLLVREHGGEFPADVEALQQLPGIGRYTAGAIASFAYDLPAPIVEANTLRLHARLLGWQDDPRKTEGQRALWGLAEALLPQQGAGEVNQALMDLGSQVCRPEKPLCGECPVAVDCEAFRQNLQSSIPAAKQRPQMTELTDVAVAIVGQGRFVLRRRGADERWAGLWDFPRFTWNGETTIERAAKAEMLRQTGLEISLGPQMAELRHSVTRYKITLKCFVAQVAGSRAFAAGDDMLWVEPEHFGNYPLSVTGRKLAERIASGLWTLVTSDAVPAKKKRQKKRN